MKRDIDCEHAIIAAALDYYEGWFDAKPARMERALHPELVKRSIEEDRSIDTISARQMIDATAAGVGRRRDPGDRRIDVHIDHVHGSIATATVTSAVYVDYLQLVRDGADWKILNVLWAKA
ncbi:MAG: nuclear transport factor 2 family protein [Ilumatobacteraceae bacterium]|nr:nuclear transport factor 2 family protein [Ilumatobacteraceae bacterium]